MAKKAKGIQSLQLPVINPNAAGIDVGSMMMMISYTDRQGINQLLEVDAFTESLQKAADTLKEAGITTAAMEATGVYWINFYGMLEEAGIIVRIINPQHFKNVDAQKTDVKDCQWIHQLLATGMLRASHIAPELYRELKSYVHERMILQKEKSDSLNRINKLLTQMNIKVQHLISDIEGVSGMKVLQGIAEGISNPEKLLGLMDVKKLKSNKEDLLKSLNGIYKKQFISILQHTLKKYNFLKEEMQSYEALIEEVLKIMLPEDEKGDKAIIKQKTSYVRKNQYTINVKQYLQHITGTDVTQIDGIDEISALDVISVTGTDMSKWPTQAHFTSWLNLAARPKITGGKTVGHEKRFTNNIATQAFRMAAQSMWKSKSSLGHMYRRLSAQKGSKKAIKAVARKLAVIFYTMLKNKTVYDKKKLEVDVDRQRAKKIKYLEKEARRYGLEVKSVAA